MRGKGSFWRVPRTRESPRVRGGCYLPGPPETAGIPKTTTVSGGQRPGVCPAIFQFASSTNPPLATVMHLAGLPDAPHFRRGEKGGDHHPKTVVVVPVVGIVPVADGAASVPAIIVEGPAPQHPVVHGHTPAPTASQAWAHELRVALVKVSACLPDSPVVAFFQPPSKRPISATMAATCRYWPADSHSQRAARRRYPRTLSSASSASRSLASRSAPCR